MRVTVIGWSDSGAVAEVDGTRCRIRLNSTRVRWLCDEHGEHSEPHCPHLHALALTPGPPERRNK